MKQQVLLSLGSNLGNKNANINAAVYYLIEGNILSNVRVSSFYETEPFGNPEQDWFLNIAVAGQTKLSPYQLLFSCKNIEFIIGRRKKQHWTEREIDIDILLFENRIINEKYLSIPHKYFCERRFVLLPSSEIMPQMQHPIQQKTITDLLKICNDICIVNKI